MLQLGKTINRSLHLN